eukprot:2546308-Amphidinium_carterae.1
MDPLSSDHRPLHYTLQGKSTKRPRPRMRWQLNKACWATFRSHVEADLPSLPCVDATHLSGHRLTKCFTQLLFRACAASIPRGRGRRSAKGWWTEDLTSKQAERAELQRQIGRATVDDERARLITRLKTSSEGFRAALRDAKVGSWRRMCTSLHKNRGNMEQSGPDPFRLLRSMAGKSSPAPNSAFRVPGRTRHSSRGKAACLVQHFRSVSTPNSLQRPLVRKELRLERDRAQRDCRAETFIDLTPSELKAAIRCLALRKAPGIDKVPDDVLAQLPHCALQYLCRLFQRLLVEGCFPFCWRVALVAPILKPGKPADTPSSFRPISLQPCLQKLFETVIARRLHRTLLPHHVQQYAYLPSRNSEQLVGALTQRIIQHMHTAGSGNDKAKGKSILVKIDLSKAFDTVLPGRLLQRLRAQGCPAHIRFWLSHMLSDHRLSVQWQHTRSKAKRAELGIPQGSALSPLLWVIYVNPILAAVSAELTSGDLHVYADDGLLHVCGSDLGHAERLASEILGRLLHALRADGLQVNELKSETMLASLKPADHSLKLNVSPVVPKDAEWIPYRLVSSDPIILERVHVHHVWPDRLSHVCTRRNLVIGVADSSYYAIVRCDDDALVNPRPLREIGLNNVVRLHLAPILPTVQSLNVLGVCLDPQMSFAGHVTGSPWCLLGPALRRYLGYCSHMDLVIV